MKENKYDDDVFFEKYSGMERSKSGLDGAGEWRTLRTLLPDFSGKRVLDLGCGFGWHCRYALENGAASVTGVDISNKMLARAKELTPSERVSYVCVPIEDVQYAPESFDVIISSLTFHYLSSFEPVCRKAYHWLANGGSFVFSVEHPVFTAYGSQDWIYGEQGEIDHWPVDRYFEEGMREAVFLGERVVKYHRTLTSYLGDLIMAGFKLKAVVEPKPDDTKLKSVPGMANELRRPMMLIVSAVKG